MSTIQQIYCPKCDRENIVIKQLESNKEIVRISMDDLEKRSQPQVVPAVVITNRWKAVCLDCEYSVIWLQGAGL